MKPDDASVMATYGRVLAMTGKTEEAKKMFEKGLNCAEAQNEKQLIEQVCIQEFCFIYRRKLPYEKNYNRN